MKKIILGLSVFILAFVCTISVLGAVTTKLANNDAGYTQNFTFFNATTTTATSTNTADTAGFKTAGAKVVSLYFSRGGVTNPNTGSSKFTIEVSPDGSSWYPYNTLKQNLATSTYPTTVDSVTISAATSTTIVQMQNLGFYAIRCIVNETTDGEHTCKASAEY